MILNCLIINIMFIQNDTLWVYSKTQLLKENKFNWITRIPHSIKKSKILLSKKIASSKWKKIEKEYKYSVHDSNYGNIPQKWLLIYSECKYGKDRKRRYFY